MRNISKSGNYSDSLNNFVINEVPNGSKCLDVGCWTGNLGVALIKEKKCRIDGLDVDNKVLTKARKAGYEKTYLVNLNNDNYSLKNINDKYDLIIFADVLEHLINPIEILQDFKKKLTPDGKIIVSLPNIGFFLNRINLLIGKWEYRDFGCLDKTHLRFYTINTAKQLVESAGMEVLKVKPYNQFGILRYLNKFNNIIPSLLAYQTLIVAKLNRSNHIL